MFVGSTWCGTAPVCAFGSMREKLVGHLWKQLGSLGSNDSGSPQHLAPASSVCVLLNTAHLCTLELGQDEWVGDILFAHEKVINKKLHLTTGARSNLRLVNGTSSCKM